MTAAGGVVIRQGLSPPVWSMRTICIRPGNPGCDGVGRNDVFILTPSIVCRFGMGISMVILSTAYCIQFSGVRDQIVRLRTSYRRGRRCNGQILLIQLAFMGLAQRRGFSGRPAASVRSRSGRWTDKDVRAQTLMPVTLGGSPGARGPCAQRTDPTTRRGEFGASDYEAFGVRRLAERRADPRATQFESAASRSR